MLWIISAVVACGIFAVVIDRKNKQIWYWKTRYDAANKLAINRFCEKKVAMEQAKAFQSVAKNMEEHLAAERSRADRLARELEKASDEILLLKSKYLALNKAKDAKKAEAGQSKQPKKEDLQTEWANILNYNGSDDGQVDV